MVNFAAAAEPKESPVQGWFCANCGARLIAVYEALPDVCPHCLDLTTWQETPPRPRVPWVDTGGVLELKEEPVNGVRCYDVGFVGRQDQEGE